MRAPALSDDGSVGQDALRPSGRDQCQDKKASKPRGRSLSGAIDRFKAAWQGLIGWFKAHVTSLPSIELPARAKDLHGGEATSAASHGATGSWDRSNLAPAASTTTAKVGGESIVRAEQGSEAKEESVNPFVPLVQDRGTVLRRP